MSNPIVQRELVGTLRMGRAFGLQLTLVVVLMLLVLLKWPSDAMVDRFLWGEVDRISPEAPVPVVRLREETVKLGGAANVAANIRALGAEVELFAAAGVEVVFTRDANGRVTGLPLGTGRAQSIRFERK